MSNTIKVFIGITVLAIIVFIAFMQISAPNPMAYRSPMPSPTMPLPTASVLPADNSSYPIHVDDQPAARSIIVKSVIMPERGYVLIYALSKNSSVSTIIGNSVLLTQGLHTNIKINLYGKDGKPYYVTLSDEFGAVLYRDDGDGKYDQADMLLPIKDQNGVIFSKSFNNNSTPLRVNR